MAADISFDHPNARRVQEALDAFASGDLDRFMSMFAEDGVFRVAGDNIISGTYRGQQEVRDYFIRLGEVTGGSMRIRLDDLVADDHHAVMFIHVTTDRNGKTLEAEAAEAFRFDDQGKISESWFLYDDQVAYNAFYQ
jgi:ketosteroid isomerase-like protein